MSAGDTGSKGLEQGWANIAPGSSVNQVLLIPSQAYSFPPCQWFFLQYCGSTEQLRQRPCDPFKKKSADPWSRAKEKGQGQTYMFGNHLDTGNADDVLQENQNVYGK